MKLEPLTITAELSGGFAASDQWSPSFDGILAYYVLRARLGDEEFALGASGHAETLEADLPMAREDFTTQSGEPLWWWRCSSPRYDKQGETMRWFHRRFDAAIAENITEAGKVLTTAGPLRNYRLGKRVILAPAVSWDVIGDRTEISRLLRTCFAIGAKTAQGLGRVTEWKIEDGDEGCAERARLNRPLPLDFALARGIIGATVMRWGIRPPAREHQAMCVMP